MSWDELVSKIDAEIEKGIGNGEDGAEEAKELMDFLKGLYEELTAEEGN